MPTTQDGLASIHRQLRALLACAGLGAGLMLSGCGSNRVATPGMISGRYIAALGDADMSAVAFASNDLGERDPSAKDTLTVLTLPIQEPDSPFGQIEVSNSALGPATGLAVTKSGRYAFVAEYRGHAPLGATSVDQLAKGNSVTAIDLSEPTKPKISGTVIVGSEPSAVAVHPSDDLVAVVTGQARQEIVMIQFKDGQFVGEPVAWPMIGLDNDEARATGIAWHPSGRALALTLQDRGEVALYRFKREPDGGLALLPWGDPIKVGRWPYTAVFSPDGKFLLVNDFRAGPGADAPGVGMPQGRVSVVRVGELPMETESSAGRPAGHVQVGFADVGVLPIGLAVSHDGKFVATANLKTSAFPAGDARLNGQQPRGGSVSLLSLGALGELTSLGEFAINAVPAGVAFDSRDRFVAVTQFRSFDPQVVDGEIAFFQIKGRGGNARLEACPFYLGAGKGPHGVLIVR